MIVMKKSLLRRIAYVSICAMVMSLATGCSLIPELGLTEEQNELVAEYAAGLLVKYQLGHSMGLTPLSATDFIEEPEVVPEVEPENVDGEETAVDETSEAGDIPESSVGEEADASETVSSSVPMNEVFNAQGFSVTPTGYEVEIVYPRSDSDNLIFSMQATPGMELLVIHFDVSNLGETETECNLLAGGVKARAIIDKGNRIPAQATILENDLLNMDTVIEPYGVRDGVLVFEIPEGTGETLTSLDLVLNGAEGENLYRLI